MAEMNEESAIVREFREKDAWGLCTCIDLKGCDPAAIRDADLIRRYVIEVCDLIRMKRFGEPQVVHFGPNDRVAGYSMTRLIETSLISGHFANEANAAYINIFSCQEVRARGGGRVHAPVLRGRLGCVPGRPESVTLFFLSSAGDAGGSDRHASCTRRGCHQKIGLPLAARQKKSGVIGWPACRSSSPPRS